MCSRRYISILLFLVGLFFLNKLMLKPGKDSWLILTYVDFHSKKILSARDVNKRMPVASLTKIATSVVVLDWAQAVSDLSAKLIVPQTAALIGGPNQLGLIPGDLMSIRDALYLLFLGLTIGQLKHWLCM